MPRPIFDIEQYELRGIKPDAFTLGQYKELNRSIGRAHGQIDWTAQLLGYNGPNYWGTSGLKADGTFVWNGLPETMVEKRQMQATTYGIFGKDKSYEQWPAPFNRSKILASGDHSFHIFETDNKTLIAPWGQGEDCDLSYDATVFVGAAYIFDGEIEVYNPNNTSGLIKTETFSEGEVLWTRMYILDTIVDDIGVKKKGSEAEYFYFKVKTWRDISDWNLKSIASQFLGVWGNKGASVSLDAQFDALHLHGFNENNHLQSLRDNKRTVNIHDVLASIGAKPTPWSAFHNLNFGFSINGSDLFYPVPQDGFDFIEFYEFSDCDVEVLVSQLIEEDEPEIIDCCEVDNELYTRLAGGYVGPEIANNGEFNIFEMETPEYCVNAIDGGSTLTGHPNSPELYCGGIEGDIDNSRPKGIGSFVFDIKPKTDCALDRLCIEWKFSSELDNGSYDDKYDWPSDDPDPTANCCLADNEETPPPYLGPNLADSNEFNGTLIEEPVACEQALVGGDYPVTYDCNPDSLDTHMPSDNMPKMGPWVTFDDGEYDSVPYPNENMAIESNCFIEGNFVSFDDGIYEEPTEPNCEIDPVPLVDGEEIWTYAFFPEYADCECSSEVCLIDNFRYLNMTAYLGDDILDGGESVINCCIIDDGVIGSGPFEYTWNAGPNLSNCGPDSAVNPYYCCDINNDEYIWTEAPYYGPDVVNGCEMSSQVSGVRYEERPIIDDDEDIVLEDCSYLPEKDNGILNIDTWSIDAEDPDCCPFTCLINNGLLEQFDDLDEDIKYDNCSLIQWNTYDTLCPEQGSIEIPEIPEPDDDTFLYDNGRYSIDSWSTIDSDPACYPYYCQLQNGKYPAALSDLEYLEEDFILAGRGTTFFNVTEEAGAAAVYGFATPMPPFVPVETTREPYLWDNGVIKEASWNAFAPNPQAYPYYTSLNNAIYPKSAEEADYTVDNCTMKVKDIIIDCPGPEIPDVAGGATQLIRVPVFSTFIVECDSCWDDCTTCEPAILCPVDDIFVKLGLFEEEEQQYKMHPGLENALTPLRLWKAPTLNVTDTVRNHDTDKWNFLVADENRGTNPEDDYRSFVRLPLEYARDGREWSKARTVCENMLYWSSTTDAVETKYTDNANPRPYLYDDVVNKDLPDNANIYFEDFLASDFVEVVEDSVQPGFVEAQISYEEPIKGAFQPFSYVEYDPFELRIPTNDGEWRGNYYRFVKQNRLSGHIAQDVDKGILELDSAPTYDMSVVKHPLSYFPEDDDKQTIKNYVVSYAYFVADYSASDEPVFEPEQDYCRRDNERTCTITDRSDNCIDTISYAATNYLLHPVA